MKRTKEIHGVSLTGSYYLPHKDYSYRDKTDHIVIHCSATPSGWDGGANEIRYWHLEEGFVDIGYHFVITRDGTIELGRPAMAVAAGERRQGMNRRALHICLVGGLADDGQTPENNYTEAQWKALRVLVEAAAEAYEIPDGSIIGHRDIKGVRKDCPCFDVQDWWRRLKEEEGHRR